jgi:tRNA(Ile)-lysidine synthase
VVLAEALHRLGARPVVLHFNHRWRGRSADADARWVRKWAQDRKLKLIPGRAAKAGRTGEGEAREARWKFFEKAVKAAKARELWLAHQGDDQAETVLMQLLRGAGPEGLSGMGESSDRGTWKVVRPLLGFSRGELRQAAREAGLIWREDSTNQDVKSWRVRIRKKVFPFLAKIYGRDVRGALARTAEPSRHKAVEIETRGLAKAGDPALVSRPRLSGADFCGSGRSPESDLGWAYLRLATARGSRGSTERQ